VLEFGDAPSTARFKFHYVALTPETNSVVKSETVTELNQAKPGMAYIDSDDNTI
jgi:hypothetical protein